ncbi:MAG: D-alanyl-D-alanine carboxypeptidase family protein [Solirubrobacteraceae bacterium]
MSRSPFLESRHGRPRHRGRRGALAALALALAALALYVGLHSGRRSAPAPHAAPAPPAAVGRRPSATRNLVDPHFGRNPRAALLVDLDSGRVLWRLNPDRVVPIASLAKMMTALLVAAHTRPTDPVRITKQALAYRGSGVGLLPGGKDVPVETLLYGLLLPSGNDAAIALAQHVAGSTTRFVAAMNRRAAQLGLSCTHYASADGFDDANRSCARDLVVLAKAILAVPRLARIVGSRSAVLSLPGRRGKIFLYNNNPLLRRLRFRGVTGIKTGETNAAGKCLVATATRGHAHLASVVLASPDLAGQSAALLEAGFRYRHAS